MGGGSGGGGRGGRKGGGGSKAPTPPPSLEHINPKEFSKDDVEWNILTTQKALDRAQKAPGELNAISRAIGATSMTPAQRAINNQIIADHKAELKYWKAVLKSGAYGK